MENLTTGANTDMDNFSYRFNLLNNCLGYGNPNAKIVYCGIEEGSDWSILNLLGLKKRGNKSPENNYKLEKLTIESIQTILENKNAKKDRFIINKINSILKEKRISIEIILQNNLKKYEGLTSNLEVPFPVGNSPYSITENFKFEFSKKICQLYPDYAINNTDYNYDKVGTKEGNEICINYYPLGRSTSQKEYFEYDLFFGLKNSLKFPTQESENKRINYLRDFFKNHINRGSFIVVLGKNVWDKIIPILKPLNAQICDEKAYCDVKTKKIRFDKKRKIVFMYHPAYRVVKYKPQINDIDKILETMLTK
jgi:hypothetical protein